ncbi:MAG: hypothetical protein ABSG86_03645 [Thermoguttaceae bacterium]|jgi:hypothetical protein
MSVVVECGLVPTIQNLRWAYRLVFALAVGLFAFSYQYSSMAHDCMRRLHDARLAHGDEPPYYSAESMAQRIEVNREEGAWELYGEISCGLTVAGMLAAFVGAALSVIVRHIEALETELAKLVKSGANPESAARELADFLRKVGPPKTQAFPGLMGAIGRLLRHARGR